MKKTVLFIIFFMPLFIMAEKRFSLIPEDIETILVERVMVEGAEERKEGDVFLWDLTNIGIHNHPSCSFMISKLSGDSIYEVTYKGLSHLIYCDDRYPYLLSKENRQYYLGSKVLLQLPSRKLYGETSVNYDYLMSGQLCGLDTIWENGSVKISQGPNGYILLPGDKKEKARVVEQCKTSKLASGKGVRVNDEDSILIEKTRYWFSDNYYYPILEERTLFKGSISNPKCKDYYLLKQPLYQDISDDEDDYNEENIIRVIKAECSGTKIQISFFVDKPDTSIEIVMCNVAGVVYYVAEQCNLPVGEHCVEIPNTNIPHGNYLVIITNENEYHKRIITI